MSRRGLTLRYRHLHLRTAFHSGRDFELIGWILTTPRQVGDTLTLREHPGWTWTVERVYPGVRDTKHESPKRHATAGLTADGVAA